MSIADTNGQQEQDPALTASILYEDEHILAVDKPGGTASIPERTPDAPDMRSMAQRAAGIPLWIVHRIDKPVSGVLLFAKSEAIHKELNALFMTRRVKKEYLALVHGKVFGKRGRIDRPIRAFGSGRMGVDDRRGKSSLTEYHVLEANGTYSLLSVLPETGRRHQIRVHLYSIGHPIVGDFLYGERALQSGYPQLMLHARRLLLPFPDRPRVEIVSPVPPQFSELVTALIENDFLP